MSENIGLISYTSLDQGYVKSYSNGTQLTIDTEVKRIVDECYSEVEELLESKRELIEKLAETLLEKETINLPIIIKCLGERPFPMKENLKVYLDEITERND